jgi:4-hydroxythreonine-4-phosphate dehydrogenase
MGDPAGIGLEITLKAWSERRDNGIGPFVLYGDVEAVAERARLLGLAVPITPVATPAAALDAFGTSLPVRPVPCRVRPRPGEPDAANATAIIMAIEEATATVVRHEAAAIVTNPIAKNVLYKSGFAEPGHTEFLASLVQEATGETRRPVMMLWSPELAVVPVTIHLPLREIFDHLSTDLIVETGRIVAHDLSRRFRLLHPRLVVAGLNPHAGEDGMLGEEDRTIVAPAVARLLAEGIDAKGPLPADTLFHKDARARYDAALCMYHDQALIPIKTLAFDHAVNVTLGLPFVRTSPDHGTAFDIAGKGVADPTSLVAALQLAARLASADQPAAISAS